MLILQVDKSCIESLFEEMEKKKLVFRKCLKIVLFYEFIQRTLFGPNILEVSKFFAFHVKVKATHSNTNFLPKTKFCLTLKIELRNGHQILNEVRSIDFCDEPRTNKEREKPPRDVYIYIDVYQM